MTRGNLGLVREGPPKTKKWMRGKSRPGRVIEILPPYKDDKNINDVMHNFFNDLYQEGPKWTVQQGKTIFKKDCS